MSSLAEPFLKAQIDLYAAQSEVAASISASPRAGDCHDLEDAIALGLTTFAGLRRHSQSCAADAIAGKVSFSWETSRRFSEQYRRWKERTGALLSVVDRHKAYRHTLSGERELRDAYKDVSLMSLDADRTRTAYESLHAGEGISHSEAMDELRRRVAARRA